MLFYIKKFTTLHNYKQSEKPFPAASSNAFFMIVLLTAYLLTTFPIVYMLYSLDPSKSCGPFMSFNRMINVVYISYISWNTNFKIFIDIITNSAFIVALLIIFIAIINQLTMQNIASKLSLSLIKRQIYETEQENRRLMKSKKTPKVNKPTTKSVESKNIYEPEIPTIKNDKIGVKKSISAWDEDSASSHRIESEQPSEEHYDYETNKAIKNKFDVQKENNKQKSSDEDVISIRDESSADAEENENKSSEVKLNVQDKNVSNPMPDDYNIPSAW
ncbi:hypothetical protein A3Q56_02800 [Intoshia linei]|uniref:TMC domain-containing protein n=1 Tax=Intoshia linei TaxID=1819745 RepID=A0A177B6V1_9BILA|nr:hypothetical protein A3Q56_02800 [Intoshia linei]